MSRRKTANKWERAGMIGIDAGLCWIGDPCYCVTPDACEHPAKTWTEFCNEMGEKDVLEFCFKRGHRGLGVCISTGYGDGSYPVFIKRKEGRISEVKVKFI
jgi:hypothetical protein